MAKARTLRGLAHDTADHASGPFGYLHPHVAEYAAASGFTEVVIDLVREPPIATPRVPRPLLLASAALQVWFREHLVAYGFQPSDIRSANLLFGAFGTSPYVSAITVTLVTPLGRSFVFKRGWPPAPAESPV